MRFLYLLMAVAPLLATEAQAGPKEQPSAACAQLRIVDTRKAESMDVVKERRRGAADMLKALAEAIESQPQADRRNILMLLKRTAEIAK